MRSLSQLVILGMVLATVASGQSPRVASGLSRRDQAALRSIAQRDSAIVLARNWDALAAEYAEDAVRLPPNQPPVQGRAAIRRWLDQLPPITSFSFHLDELHGTGSLAYLRGSYTITVAPSGAAPISDAGKELIVLRRQADGSWLRVADAWNSNLAPPK